MTCLDLEKQKIIMLNSTKVVPKTKEVIIAPSCYLISEPSGHVGSLIAIPRNELGAYLYNTAAFFKTIT